MANQFWGMKMWIFWPDPVDWQISRSERPLIPSLWSILMGSLTRRSSVTWCRRLCQRKMLWKWRSIFLGTRQNKRSLYSLFINIECWQNVWYWWKWNYWLYRVHDFVSYHEWWNTRWSKTLEDKIKGFLVFL